MTREEQIKFVRDLTSSIQASLIEKIEAGKVPQEWNGIELRQLLADTFQFNTTGKMNRKQKRAYTNAVIVNNL